MKDNTKKVAREVERYIPIKHRRRVVHEEETKDEMKQYSRYGIQPEDEDT
jgi:hypothetical protein